MILRPIQSDTEITTVTALIFETFKGTNAVVRPSGYRSMLAKYFKHKEQCSLIAIVEDEIIGCNIFAPFTLTQTRKRYCQFLLSLTNQEEDVNKWLSKKSNSITRITQYGCDIEEILNEDFYDAVLCVKPEHRKKGIARELIEAMCEQAEENQAKYIHVECYMRGGSHILYGKMGFKPIVQLDNAYEDGSDCLAMYKAL